ncbi:MAG: TOBE domain-containing protein [Janthinobacterium lividum]
MRPEQLRLGAGGAAGTVQAVRFMGSFYEVEIHLLENTVRARLGQPMTVGEPVQVAVTESWVVSAAIASTRP